MQAKRLTDGGCTAACATIRNQGRACGLRFSAHRLRSGSRRASRHVPIQWKPECLKHKDKAAEGLAENAQRALNHYKQQRNVRATSGFKQLPPQHSCVFPCEIAAASPFPILQKWLAFSTPPVRLRLPTATRRARKRNRP